MPPNQADALRVGDIQVDAAHDGRTADGNVQVTNRNAHRAPRNRGFVNGSAASRSASPNRFNATTTSVTISPATARSADTR